MEEQGFMGGEQGLWQLGMVAAWVVVVLVPFWRISSKAGYSGWWSLLILVPVVNLIYLYYLAFANWPALRRF